MVDRRATPRATSAPHPGTVAHMGWSSFAMLQRYNISDEGDALAAVAARAAGQSAGQSPTNEASGAR